MKPGLQKATKGLKPLSSGAPVGPTSGLGSGKPLALVGPELDTRMRRLKTRVVDTSTLDRFLAPIESLIQAFLEGAKAIAQQRATRAESKRVLEIARLLEAAQEDMQRGKWGSALRRLDRVLHLDSAMYEAMFLKAICLGGLERLAEGIALAREGQRLCRHPQLKEAFGMLAEALTFAQSFRPMAQARAAMEKSRYDEALARLDEALRYAPDEGLPLYLKAICLLQLARWQQALPLLSTLHDGFGDQAFYHYHVAVCHLMLGDTTAAGRALRAARKHNPEPRLREELDRVEEGLRAKIEAGPRLGVLAAMRSGQWSEALSALQAMAVTDGSSAWVHYHIAICHLESAKAGKQHSLLRAATVLPKIRLAKLALDTARQHVKTTEPELRQAIDNLLLQLPDVGGAW